MQSLKPFFQSTWTIARDSAVGFVDSCALRLSAALAYYSVFSLAPLLMLAIGLSSVIFGEEAVRGEVSEHLRAYMGWSAAEGVEAMLKSTTIRGDGMLAVTTGCVTLLIGASGVFGQLKDALNTIWEVKAKAGKGFAAFIRDRLLAFGIVLVIGFLLLVSLVASTLLSSLSDYTQSRVPVPEVLWSSFNMGISLLVSITLFAAIFKILPDVRIPWRTVAVGAGVTGILFELGKFGLAFYLGRESTVSTFGAAGSIVLVLLWVYYASAILLFGAHLTKAYARHTNAPISIRSFAQPISTVERKMEGMA